MKAYNVYYKNAKVNNKPLQYDELIKLISNPSFVKDASKLNVKDLQIIKCTLL